MTDSMPLPDLEYQAFAVPAGSDFAVIVDAVKAVPGCEPQPNALGNMQAVHRIDPDGNGGYVLTVPVGADIDGINCAIREGS